VEVYMEVYMEVFMEVYMEEYMKVYMEVIREPKPDNLDKSTFRPSIHFSISFQD